MKRRVLIVDDSALVRQTLARILGRHPDLEVVGFAGDPYEAREKIIALSPDVVTLDVEMPRMDGLTFLGKLMKVRPLPVVMVSSLTAAGTRVALEALALGAVDVIGKPVQDPALGLEQLQEEIAEAVHGASLARLRSTEPPVPMAVPQPRLGPDAVLPPRARRPAADGAPVIALGASTGGTEAIRILLEALPEGLPPILVVQHMLPGFMRSFAERLHRLSALEVREAQDGEVPEDGVVYLGPTNRHLVLEARGSRRVIRLLEGPRVNRHLPSVDVLMRSVAQVAGPRALGVILTGMGDDGALGLLEMRQAGASTLGQDEATSVIYGMPRVAFERGAVERQVPLQGLAASIVRWAQTL